MLRSKRSWGSGILGALLGLVALVAALVVVPARVALALDDVPDELEYFPVHPVELVEGVDLASWKEWTDDGYVTKSDYRIPFAEGDKLRITWAGGGTTDYEYRVPDYDEEPAFFPDDDSDSLMVSELWYYYEEDSSQWALGAHTLTLCIDGAMCEVPVTLVANPVASISYVPAVALEVMEGTAIEMEDYDDEGDPITYEAYNSSFLYWPSEGDQLTVTMTDGTSKVYTYFTGIELDDGDWDDAFVAENGEMISEQDVSWRNDQGPDNVWTPDNPGKLTISYRGRTTTLDVTVKPNNITSLSFEPASAKVLYEGIDSYEVTDEDETWLAYMAPMPAEGDRLVVTTTSETKTYVYRDWAFVNEDDDEDVIGDDLVVTDMVQSYEHPAQVGVNQGTLRYLGHEASFDITLKKANIKSLSFIPDKPIIFIEGEDGTDETDASGKTYTHYQYQMQSGDQVVLTMDDGAKLEYYQMENSLWGTTVFVKNEGVGMITVEPLTSDQATKHWGVGDHSFTFSYGGASCTVPAEVRASGDDRLIDLAKATIDPIPDQSYTGHEVYPVTSVSYNGKELYQSEDIELEYANNVEVGTAKVTITGKGDYKGTKTVTFKIVKDYTIKNGVLTFNDASKPKGYKLSFDAPERSRFDGLIYGVIAKYNTFFIVNENSEFSWGNDYYIRDGGSASFAIYAPGETYFSGARLEPANAGTLNWNSGSTASLKIFTVSLTKPAKLVLETNELPYVEVARNKDSQVAVAVPEGLKGEYAGMTFVADKRTDEPYASNALSIINDHYQGRQFDQSDVILYDFHFEYANGEIVHPLPTRGTTFMRVTIPLPEGWTCGETSVYHVDDSDFPEFSYVERYDAYPSSDGKSLTVYVNHFSMFALVNEKHESPAGAVPVYRLYNHKTSEHLWTTSANEYRQLPIITKGDWRQEAVAWLAPDGVGTPVYRLYNKKMGDHYYSMSQGEINALTTKYGWTVDNGGAPAFWSAAKGDGGAIPLYCVYNSRLKKGQHHFTRSVAERDFLTTKAGWRYEKEAFYGYLPQ